MSEASFQKLPFAKSYRDLVVYKKQRELAREIFRISKGFPVEEKYSLTDQVRRSSRSIGAQLAEAWAKRRYEKHFLSKLTDSDGEREETQHWIETAHDCGYLAEGDKARLLGYCEEIGKMLASMMARADHFCPESSVVREEPSESDF